MDNLRKPRGSMAIGSCMVPVCGATCAPDHLMCGHHWAMVPQVIQDRVYASWRWFTGRAPRPDGTDVRRAYLAARADAIEAVLEALGEADKLKAARERRAALGVF